MNNVELKIAARESNHGEGKGGDIDNDEYNGDLKMNFCRQMS